MVSTSNWSAHFLHTQHIVDFYIEIYRQQANATGRSAKTVREFLEKYYTEELVSTENGTVKLAIKALLEVVQSGRKNLEIAVMRRGEPMQVMSKIR